MTPSFPGATGLTVLDVYDWVAPDGLRGGSAHVHLASAEGYLVVSGAGELQTLGARGYASTPLRPGDCVWFTPGTIHRLVNEGGLRLAIVMQNAGLPEHGDAVLTFPPAILADQGAYDAAATLSGERGEDELARQARRRASLAVEGYLTLRAEVAERGPAALEDFFAAALRLKAGLVPDWRDRWRAGALAAAEQTGEHLDEIAAAVPGHLAEAGLWRIDSPMPPMISGDTAVPAAAAGEPTGATGERDSRGYGMCGRLTTYPAVGAARLL